LAVWFERLIFECFGVEVTAGPVKALEGPIVEQEEYEWEGDKHRFCHEAKGEYDKE